MKKLSDEFKGFLNNFIKVIRRPEMAILPGQLAFFFVLAIVPTITLISYTATILNVSTDFIFEFFKGAFSEDIAKLFLLSPDSTVNGFGFIILMVTGYFVASNGPASIIITSNAIYGEKQPNYINRRIKAMFMTFILVLLFIFMLIVPVFGNKIVEIFSYINMDDVVREKVALLFGFLQGPIAWVIMYLFIKLLYIIAPNYGVKRKTVGYGAIFTSVSWILITYVYSFYINHLAHYSTFYGGLANIVVLMIWIYLLAYAFTIGIALNYRRDEEELEKTGTIILE